MKDRSETFLPCHRLARTIGAYRLSAHQRQRYELQLRVGLLGSSYLKPDINSD